MSLVTRCPACATAFKVVRDQLRISEGWVRCGRCNHVFDAAQDLQASEGEPPFPVPHSPGPAPSDAQATQAEGQTQAIAAAAMTPEPPREPAPPSGVASPASIDAAAVVEELPGWAPQATRVQAPPPEPPAHEPSSRSTLPEAKPPVDAHDDASIEAPLLPQQALPPIWLSAESLNLQPVNEAAPVPQPVPGDEPSEGARREGPPAPSMPTANAEMVPARLLREEAVAPAPLAGIADEPRPVQAPDAGTPALPDAGALVTAEAPAPSAVDEAVSAQLQRALLRVRIKALRESFVRDGKTPPRERERPRKRRSSREGTAGAAPTDAPSAAREASADPGHVISVANGMTAPSLRHASNDGATPVLVPAGEETAATPGFMGEAITTAPARAFSPRRGVVVGLIAWVGLLLLLQVMRGERDGLAARYPGLQPALAALCRVSGCELGALRRIDAIRIDGSAFTPERDGAGYQLLFSLRSLAPTPLAMPAIQLSLLDGNERTIVRRVFLPADFGGPATLVPRGEQSVTLPLALKRPSDGSLPAVAGYSMLVFYP